MTAAQRAFIAATRLGARPEDSAVDRLQRGLLVSVLVIVIGPCLAWGALYWLADRLVCEPHGPIEVKGKGVVETWLLRAERPSGA